MLKTLFIIEDPLDVSSMERIDTDDICAALAERFAKCPPTAKLYCGSVSQQDEVTPQNETEVEALAHMTGPFYFIVYPADPFNLAYTFYYLAAIAAVALVASIPKIPSVVNRNVQSESPNNSLSERTNRARINGRIPDIFGTVRSVPDLIATPYTVFNDEHVEVEYSFMCIGRGAYEFPLVDGIESIRDGQTLASKIEAMKVDIYAPGASPNDASFPQISIGGGITEPVISAVRSKAVNGQVMRAPNDSGEETVTGNLRYLPDTGSGFTIEADPAGAVDFTAIFNPADVLVLTAPNFCAGILTEGSDPGNFDATPWPDVPPGPSYDVQFHADGTVHFVGAGTPFAEADAFSTILGITVAPITKDSITVNLTGYYKLEARVIPVESSTDFYFDLGIPAWLQAEWTAILGMTDDKTNTVAASFSQVSFVNGPIGLSGEYTVNTVAEKTLTLLNAADDNGDWAKCVVSLPTTGGYSPFGDYAPGTAESLGSASSANWIGPFVLDNATMNEVIANFVAPQGLYKDSGTSQSAFNIEVQLGITPCNAAGVSTGTESFFNTTILGSATVKSQRAKTLRQVLLTAGRVKVRARRLTPKDTAFSGQVVDEVKWRDIYAVTPVGNIDFGDVTTVYAVTQATAGALAVAERQFNCLVQRKVYPYLGSGEFAASLVGSNDAADIFSFITRDPKIGNRDSTEADFDQIYAAIADVKSLFGFDEAGEFSYTFDKANLSFEETAQLVANAVFCFAYRRGKVIELFFEQATNDSLLLFGHRNKIPGTELRTATFGNVGNHDGIEYEYVSPVDDALVTLFVPEDGSAINPKKVESVGIRNAQQAHLQAYRAYNKMQYQHTAVEFDALQEADILIKGNRILVANGIRSGTQDGEIKSQVGLVLELSQPVVFEVGLDYVIFLQHIDATVEVIDITAGVDEYHVVLADAPAAALSLDDEASVRTLYHIVKDTDQQKNAFLLDSKEYNDNFTCKVTAVNYDARYYANDLDFAP